MSALPTSSRKGPLDLRSFVQSQLLEIGLCVVLCVVFLTTSILYLINLVQWGRSPDFGWTIIDQMETKVLVEVYGHAEKAGLRAGDRVMSVNGVRVDSFFQLRELLRREPGAENAYEVDRNGKTLHVMVPNMPMGLRNAFVKYGLTWMLGLIFFVLGVIVFSMKPKSRPSFAFLIVLFNAGLSIMFTFVSKFSPVWLGSVYIFTSAFLPASILHITQTFPEERNWTKERPLSLWIPYGASLALFLIMHGSAPIFSDVPILWQQVTGAYFALALGAFVLSTLWSFLRGSDIFRVRAKVILIGSAIAVSIPVADMLSTLFVHHMLHPHPVFNLPFYMFLPLSIGYCIVKHNLFDVDTYIKRAVGYIFMTGLLAAAYLLSQVAMESLILNPLLGDYSGVVFPVVFSIAVVFLFNPVRDRVQKFIDRIFYRLEYDYQETVDRISETMRSLLDLDTIVHNIMDTILGTMFVDSGCVVLLGREKRFYECRSAAGKETGSSQRVNLRWTETLPCRAADKEPSEPEHSFLPRSGNWGGEDTNDKSPGGIKVDTRHARLPDQELSISDALIGRIAETQKELTIYDIQEDPSLAQHRESCMITFERMGAILLVPMVYKDDLIGIMGLGTKKSGKSYRREDINLLKTLANQATVAIENALLLEEVVEKERMEEELAIARDLQMSMIPSECPKFENFQVAALTVPAREVGGDFYDFMDLGDKRLGLVVGDVAGKSVSGALVMAASRSIFRMLSEQRLSVAEIMIQANRRTKKDIRKGMFVALLLAVIEADDRTLTLSSAGQTQPIHFRAETGKASLVETTGDNFPLGVLEDVAYEGTRLRLGVGDTVVFYTDGIVEAMNELDEMFGFDRLLEVIEGSLPNAPDFLLKEIIDHVNAFAGQAAQHDDLTVIVVNATR